MYEGYFLDNKAYGTGRKIWDKSEKGNMVTYYTGEFSDGLKHGKGYYQFKEGTYYDGQFVKDARCGRGIMVWTQKDGRIQPAKYEGKWENNMRNGLGVMTYGDGKVYNGMWLNDKRHGKGKLKDKDGKVIHEGEWNNGKPGKASKGWFGK